MSWKEEAGQAAGKAVKSFLTGIFGNRVAKEAGERAAKVATGAVTRSLNPRTIGSIGARDLRSGGRSAVDFTRGIISRSESPETAALREATARLSMRPNEILARRGGRMVSAQETADWQKQLDELAQLDEALKSPEVEALRRIDTLPDNQLSVAELRLKKRLASGKPLNAKERVEFARQQFATRPVVATLKYGALPAAGGAVGYSLYNNIRGGGSSGMTTPVTAADIAAQTPAQQDPYDQMLQLIEQSYAGTDPLVAEAQASLQAYLNNMNQYAATQGPAIRKAYEDLANQAAAEAAVAYATGQGVAGDVSQMYQTAADQAAAYGAGEGLTTGGEDVAGLTGVSGQMALAPGETGAYGASLADYLGRSAGITRDDLTSAARSYQAAGIGSEAELQNMAAALGAQREYELGQRLAEYNAQRAAAREQALLDLALQRIQYNAELNPPMSQDVIRANTIRATRAFDELSDDEEQKVIAAFGSKEAFISSYVRDPDSTTSALSSLVD